VLEVIDYECSPAHINYIDLHKYPNKSLKYMHKIHIEGLPGEIQGCNGIGGKAYVKSSIIRLKL